MAERVGFEPTVGLHPQQFSRLPRSATLAPLRRTLERAYKGGALPLQWGLRNCPLIFGEDGPLTNQH